MKEGEALKLLIYRDIRQRKEISKLTGIPESTINDLYKKDEIPLKYKILFGEIGIAIDSYAIAKLESLDAKREDVHSGVKKVKTGNVLEYNGGKGNGSRVKKIPFYAANPNAGLIGRLGGEVMTPEFFVGIPHFVDCSLALRVSGNSMYPKYCNGDIVICKEIKGRTTILWGEPYVVVSNDYCTVKFINKHKDPDFVILKSYNDAFAEAEIAKTEIKELYLVRGKIEIS